MPVSFEADVKHLFRQKDRDAMLAAKGFDLWKYEDAVKWAEGISFQVENGYMPCDGPWPKEKVKTFQGWIKDGMNP